MTTRIELGVGVQTWRVNVRPEALISLERPTVPLTQLGPKEQILAAIEKPFDLDAPLKRAITPEDRITIVLDERLPHIAELLTGVIEHLQSGGVEPTAITVVVPPGSQSETWIDELPDEVSDIHLETHDPEDKNKLAYLATTKTGRRVYLNRTLVEADFVIVLTGRRYDPTLGYSGAESAIFPTLSDAESLTDCVGKFSTDQPKIRNAARAEANEILWLFGNPFFIQVIEDTGDQIFEIVAGLSSSLTEGIYRQDLRWKTSITESPDLVIATIAGSPKRVDFLALASALGCAARVVQSGGRIALLTEAAPNLDEGAEILRDADDPARAEKLFAKRKPDDWPAASLWAFAAKRANLFIASRWPEEVVESLFATPLASASEAQRLIEAAKRVLVIPDAHKTSVELR